MSSHNAPPPTAPFVITAGGRTISGTVHGSTAAVVAGKTVAARGPPSSAGGALISVHTDASNIAVNGESQSLPTPVSAPPTIPFVVTAGCHTIVVTVQGSIAAVIAGTTIAAGGSPSSAGGAHINPSWGIWYRGKR